MTELTAEQIAQRSLNLDLISLRQIESIWGECGTRDVPVDEFNKLLLKRELLTNYQLDRLLRGEKTGFHYGDYKVLYLVGTGSFARVYRAVHKEDGRVVAIKVLRKRFSDSAAQTDQFLREGKMGTKLRHPNIVPIYEVHSNRPVYFLVMAFVEGQSLREFVKIRKKLAPAEATKLFAGIVSGLAHAAEKGITHRDLKLSNVLISADGRPQLVDFGLAGVDDADETNPRTIDYAGLERATGTRKDDPRSDIYFAGCMFYHMLSGKPPLAETRDRVQRLSISRFQQVKPIRELVPDLPPQVEAIVRKSMELNPKQRYNKPVEMLVDLNKAIKSFESPKSEPTAPAIPDRKIMLVESNSAVQDALKKGLKKHGFRLLVVTDPERALSRLQSDPQAAQCLIISTNDIGSDGVDLFNKLAQGPTGDLPSILLLGQSQGDLKANASVSEQHVAVSLPLRMSQLRSLLNKLVPLEMDNA